MYFCPRGVLGVDLFALDKDMYEKIFSLVFHFGDCEDTKYTGWIIKKGDGSKMEREE